MDIFHSINEHKKNVIASKNISYAAQNQAATCVRNADNKITQQAQQTFISNYMNENSPVKGMVLWHGLGSGKTLTSIFTTQLNNRNIVVMAPASLIGNYRKELFAVTEKIEQEEYRRYYERLGTLFPSCELADITIKTQNTKKTRSKRFVGNRTRKSQKRQLKIPALLATAAASAVAASVQSDAPAPLAAANVDYDRIAHENKKKCNKDVESGSIKFPVDKKFIDKDQNIYINTYFFYSHNGDINVKNIENYKYFFRKNAFIIIDESQLLISKIFNSIIQNKSDSSVYNFYKRFFQYFRPNNLKVLCLSGTPIVNDPGELAVLFNMLSGNEHLFNVRNFRNIYGLVGNLQKYEYSFTNEERQRHINNIINGSFINNAVDFQKKIYGLLSYFGNIPRLLPNIPKITDREILAKSFGDGGAAANIKCGFNNDGNVLFFIKECQMSEEQYNRIRIMNSLIKLTKTAGAAATAMTTAPTTAVAVTLTETAVPKSTPSQNEYLIGFKTISYDFAINIDAIDAIKPAILQIIQDIPNDKQITRATLTNNNTIKENINSIEELKLLRWEKTFLTEKNERYRKIKQIYNKFFNSFLELIIHENPTFSGAAEAADIEYLKNYSCKIYEICQHIRRNPNEKHIIYCETRRVNVILARALRAYCNYEEWYKGSVSAGKKGYMFLTGSSVDRNEEEDDVFIKYYANEGKLRGDPVHKEFMIDYFNGDENKSVNVVILNSAAAEGITLKGVNYVHLLQVPPNMSRLYQIIGRAIRNCTHENYQNKTVTPILYIATHPKILNENNSDITRYTKIVNTNDAILPYLGLLKKTAVDCELNREIPGSGAVECFNATAAAHTVVAPVEPSPEKVISLPKFVAQTRKRRRSGTPSPSGTKRRA